VQIHPIVGGVQRRRQQCRTDTFALPRHRYTHAEVAGMAAPDPRKLLQANAADDHSLMQSHQLQMSFVARIQAFAPDLGGLKRHYPAV
jgi:ABC-type microcin C transport system duplicated ATPase subunit YejF